MINVRVVADLVVAELRGGGGPDALANAQRSGAGWVPARMNRVQIGPCPDV
jgi:hypothetical protein